MLKPKIIPLKYTYKNSDSDLWVLNLTELPIDYSQIKDQQLICFAPGSVGGNHYHQRKEWFIGFGDLEFIWLDEDNKKQIIPINPNGKIQIIEVPPLLSHAVRNVSNDKQAILYELANQKMKKGEAEKVEII